MNGGEGAGGISKKGGVEVGMRGIGSSFFTGLIIKNKKIKKVGKLKSIRVSAIELAGVSDMGNCITPLHTLPDKGSRG